MVRYQRKTLRFTATEQAQIEQFASQQKLSFSEAVRRLIFWSRAPDFVLPELTRGRGTAS
jgi:hypothetical protein